MSDDSFIREVNQELRQDQARALWDRFGPMGLAIAAAVVLATAAYVGYNHWVGNKANVSGDQFSQALALAQGGKTDEALASLEGVGDRRPRRLPAACPHACGDGDGREG